MTIAGTVCAWCGLRWWRKGGGDDARAKNQIFCFFATTLAHAAGVRHATSTHRPPCAIRHVSRSSPVEREEGRRMGARGEAEAEADAKQQQRQQAAASLAVRSIAAVALALGFHTHPVPFESRSPVPRTRLVCCQPIAAIGVITCADRKLDRNRAFIPSRAAAVRRHPSHISKWHQQVASKLTSGACRATIKQRNRTTPPTCVATLNSTRNSHNRSSC